MNFRLKNDFYLFFILIVLYLIIPLTCSPNFDHPNVDFKLLIYSVSLLGLILFGFKRKTKFYFYPNIFILLYILGYIFSSQFAQNLHRLFLFQGLFFANAILCLILPVQKKEDSFKYLHFICIGQLIPSLIIIINAYGFEILNFIGNAAFPSGTYAYKSVVGHVVCLVAPLSLGMSIYKKNHFSSLFYWVIFSLTFSSSIVSHTRAGIYGLTLGSIILVLLFVFSNFSKFLREISKKKVMIFISKLLILIFFIGISYLSYFYPKNDSEYQQYYINQNKVITKFKKAMGWRRYRWINSIYLAQENVNGIGAGQFRIIYPLYHMSKAPDLESRSIYRPDNPHNLYIEILCEGGIISFIGFMGLLIFILFISIKSYILGRDRLWQSIVLGTMASFMFVATFTYPLARPTASIIFWSFVAIVFHKHYENKEYVYHKELNLLKFGFILFALLAAFYLFKVSAVSYLTTTARNATDDQVKLARYELAYKFSPDYYRLSMYYARFLRKYDFPKAIRVLENAVKGSPNFYEARFELARLLALKGKKQKAIFQCQQILDVWPRHEGAKWLLKRVQR
ncbi:MAG: O-antigen ligase family protein [Pseudomonadota bacterium]